MKSANLADDFIFFSIVSDQWEVQPEKFDGTSMPGDAFFHMIELEWGRI